MSMYNMLHGFNPAATLCLGALDLAATEFGRFRDAFLCNGEIVVHTRCGGGNREDYQHVFDKMREHPDFLRDYDDSFDSTYADFVFRFPEKHAEFLKELEQAAKEEGFEGSTDYKAQFEKSLERIKTEGPSPKEKELMDQIGKALETGKGGVIKI